MPCEGVGHGRVNMKGPVGIGEPEQTEHLFRADYDAEFEAADTRLVVGDHEVADD